MYEQVEKPKENKSRAVANSVAQKKSNDRRGFGFVDNRSDAIVQRETKEMDCHHLNKNIEQEKGTDVKNNVLDHVNITSKIAQFRTEGIVQRTFAWSDIGEDGVLMGADEAYVIKLGGFDELAVGLDQLGESFGFTTSHARIVTKDDECWSLVLRATTEAGGWDKSGSDEANNRALIMDKIVGNPLHETTENISTVDPVKPQDNELKKIQRMCRDLGKMLVMDLLIRNNDRFNLVALDNNLLSTEMEKQLDEDEWRRWMANEGNILVNEATGEATPIDSQYTEASNEPLYAHNVAQLLTTEVDALVTEGMKILGDHNWSGQEYASLAFKQGVEMGIDCLMSL